MAYVAPSILSADFAKLGEDVRNMEEYGADYIHIDVMDGHFVPNITIGPLIVSALRPVTDLTLDVHLMIENPDQYVPSFAEAGADIITVHYEACIHLHRTIQLIKSLGKKVGVALNPATPVELLINILDEVDMVLIMTVNPGFGGQKFIESTLNKMKKLSQMRKERNLHFDIEVDGGVNQVTAKQCVEAGANVLVAGSYIFHANNQREALQSLK